MADMDKWPELQEVAAKNLTSLKLSGEEVATRLEVSDEVLIEAHEASGHPTVYTVFLPEALFTLTSLVTLEINDANLNLLPYKLTQLVNLERVSFARNNISAMHEWFNAMPKMKYMDLSHNALVVVPEEFNIPFVEVCDVSHNKLVCFPDISPAEYLTKLILHHNKLEVLPEGMMFCEKLREIDVSYNLFEVVDAKYIKEMKSLREIKYSHNEITILPVPLSECRHLEQLKLDGNPLEDAELKYLADEQKSVKEILDHLVGSK